MAQTIRLNIDFNVHDAEQTAQQLSKEVESLFSNKRQSPQMMGLLSQLKQGDQAAVQLQQRLEAIRNAQYEPQFGDTIASAIADVEQYSAELENVQQRMLELGAHPMDFASPQAESLFTQLVDGMSEVDHLQAELDGLTSKMEAMYNQPVFDVEQFQDMQQRAVAISQRLGEIGDLRNRVMQMEDSGTLFGPHTEATLTALETQLKSITNMMNDAADTANALSEAEVQGAQMFAQAQQQAEKETETALDKQNDKTKQLIVKYRELGNEAKKTGKNMSGAFAGASRGIGNALKGLKRMAITVAGVVLGVRGMMSIINKIRSAILAGFKEIYNYDKNFKSQIDSVKNAWDEVKVSLAAAFQPIVEMAIPYIQMLLEWLQKVIGYIASFTAAIAGQNAYTKAIKKTGEAAGSASKQLSKFDELNNLSSGSGGGESGFNFEQVPVDSKVLDWLEKIKTLTGAIKDQFMEWVGTPFLEGLQPEKTKKLFLDLIDDCKLLGENVKKIFNDPEIQAAQKKFVQTTSKTLGSLTGLGTDVALIIGDAVVDGFNKYVTENEGKVKGNMLTRLFDFTSLIEQIGTIADAFRDIFSVVHDNEDAINIVSNGFSAWDDLLTGLIDLFAQITVGFTNMFALPITENVEGWQTAIEDLLKVGSDVSDFFAGAFEDIKGWLSKIGEIFGNFFTKVGGVLAKVTAKILEIWDKVYPVFQSLIGEIQSIWNEYIAPIVDDILWIVGDFVSKIGAWIERIWSWLQPVVQWIIDYVVPVLVPILKGIITIVGSIIKIALIPLKATLTAIKSLLQLINGDVEGAGETWKKFGEGIKNTFAGIAEKFKGIWEELKAGLDTLFGQFQEWGEKIYGPNGIWQTFFNIIGTKWEEFWTNVFDFWSGVGDKIMGVMTSIKDWFSARIDDIKGFFKDLGDKAKKLFTETIPQFFENIKQKFNLLKTNLQTGVNNIITFFTNFKTKLSSIVNNIKTFFTNLGTFFNTLFTQTIPNIFKKGVNLAIGFINKLIDGVQSAVNLIINALNQLNWTVPNWIPGIGGSSFGFNIQPATFNKIPALAQGTVIPPSMGDFIARLGDNNRETEVVSPLSTIKQALSEAMQEMNFGGDISVNLVVDGKVLANTIVKQDSLARRARGVGLFGT